MKIGEARNAFYAQYKKFSEAAAQAALEKKKLEDDTQGKITGKDAETAVTLELRYQAYSKKAEEYIDYQSGIIEQECALANMKSSEQQADAIEKGFEDLSKIMVVARRLMHGDIVPAGDERKLMEYDDELYMSCKEMQMMAQLEKRKKYESLWEDEEQQEIEDPMEYADNQEIDISNGPSLDLEVVDVEISAAEI